MPGSFDRALRAGTQHTDWQELFSSEGADVLFQIGMDGRVIWISPSVQTMLGFDPDELIATDMSALMEPDDRARVAAAASRTLGGEAVDFAELRVQTKSGEHRTIESRARPLRDATGAPIGSLIVWQDISERLAAARAFTTVVEGTRIMLHTDNEQDLLQAMCELIAREGGYAFAWYGIPVDDAEKSVRVVAKGGNDHGYVDSIRTSWGAGPLAQGPTGTALRTGLTQVRDDLAHDPGFAPWRERAVGLGLQCSIVLPVQVAHEVHGALMVYSTEPRAFDARAQQLLETLAADLGGAIERFRAARQLEHELHFDSLTGLANRRVALTRIQEILNTRRDHDWALLCVGVDAMTAINQAYTHSAGDAVLREVAQRIVHAAGTHDRVGRIAGDEFAVMLREVVTAADAAEAAERILAAVRGPLHVGDTRIEISACVGIAMRTSDDADAMLRDATAAMRVASRSGRDRWAFLDENVAASSRRVLELQSRLSDALTAGHVEPWFMGIHELETGRLVGYEALARWRNADGSISTPDEFLRVAERSSLIVELDRLMLRTSLDALSQLEPDTHVAVNLSAATLRAVDLYAFVRAELSASDVDPARLHLEVTETELFDANETTLLEMRALAGLGIKWWVDDFGTGYSSISHLRDMPVAGVKLDRSFSAGLGDGDPKRERLTHGLAGLASGLGLDTIAEGVETAEQAAVLAAQGWRLGQGWLFGKPAPVRR